MASKRVEMGVTGETVRERVRTIRKQQGLTLGDLSERLAAVGHKMSTSTLFEIESGGRRVDVDDLVRLAKVLGVSPTTLLMPHPAGMNDRVVIADTEVTAAVCWDWLSGGRPLEGDPSTLDLIDYRMKATPRWSIRIGSGDLPAAKFEEWWKGTPDGND